VAVVIVHRVEYVTGFFQPPPDPWPEQAPVSNSPRWTGRPHGPQGNEAVSNFLLGESALATVSLAYVDAYPDGFELEISASTKVPYRDLRRDGDESGPDVFGRHWPVVGENRDALLPQLLRVGVQFSDGRRATSIGGHDRPLNGPVIWPLSGGGHGSGGESRFHQGYWISPLPPAGVLTVVCEWPALGIPLVSQEIDARLLFSAAERARALFPNGSHVSRDGREWRLGTESDVAFISEGATSGTAIGGTIPAIYAAYCFLELPQHGARAELSKHEQATIELLTEETNQQPWWLGYLDTGAHDVVFPYAPRTIPFYGHEYVLVQAGPRQAATWRNKGWNWALPDLMFPADRSWLLSTGWDDAWTCIGGSEQFVSSFVSHPILGPRAKHNLPSG
jgi:hypothetical protein